MDRAAEAAGRQTLAQADYEPVGPWPGGNDRPWHVRCSRCGAEVLVTVYSAQRRGRPGDCRHRVEATVRPSDAALRKAAEEANTPYQWGRRSGRERPA